MGLQVRRASFFLLIVVVLLAGGCTFPVVRSHSASAVTLQEWVDKQSFGPVILWPLPEGISLWLPPRYIDGPGHVELFYAGAFVDPGVEPPMYMLYESDSELPIGRSILADYAESNTAVTSQSMNLVISGRAVLAEIRRNSGFPDSGVIIFELCGTQIAGHWRQMPRASALDVLQESAMLVETGDSDIISAFDRMVDVKFD
jgi:hypothetical protein